MSNRLNLNINPLVSLLTGIISCRSNSVYKCLDIAYRLVQSAIGNQSLEAMYKLTQYLSADRMLSKLHTISAENIQELTNKCNKKLKLPRKVILAIDFTEKEFYGDKNYPEIMGSKGGKYVRRYIEVSTAKPALFINALPVNQFTNDKETLLTSLLNQFYEQFSKTKIELLLLDRGFYTKDVVRSLTQRKIHFIMPAIKNKAINKLAKQYEKGEIKDRIKYRFGKTQVYLTFIKIEDETYVSMTNTRKNPLKIHLLYKKRWQIETNFREQNKFTFKTCSTNFNIRYLSFIIGGLLFNAWQLTRNTLIYKPESYLFKQLLTDELLTQWQTLTKRRIIKSLDYFLPA